jgi:hypothetical protein
MEKNVLKLVTHLALIAVVAYVVAVLVDRAREASGAKSNLAEKLTAFPAASRAWVTGIVSAPRAQSASVQPQSMLYAS